MISPFSFIYFYQRKILPGLHLPKDALVVDFGSGDKPFWRADIFVDDITIGNNQRATRKETVKTLGTFVNADLCKLPFSDGAFDFSFASHVLEHVERPDQALKEIIRVSKAGYLEFPSGFFEILSPAPCHLWCIYPNQKQLIFFRKSKKMQEIFFANKYSNKRLASKMKNPFLTFYWKKNISYKIMDIAQNEKFKVKDEKFTQADTYKENSVYMLIILSIRFLFYKKKFIPNSIYKNYKKSKL